MRHGVFVLTIDGRRTGAPHGTLLASLAAVPRRHMLYLRRYCHIICTIGHEVPPRIEVELQDLHERGSVTAPVLRAANTCFDGLDGRRRRRPGARRRPSIARRPTRSHAKSNRDGLGCDWVAQWSNAVQIKLHISRIIAARHHVIDAWPPDLLVDFHTGSRVCALCGNQNFTARSC